MIATDSTVSINLNNSATTWSHTCTGSNLILIVGVDVTAAQGAGAMGVTYGAQSMTFLNSIQTAVGNYIHVYYLINPATGTHTVTTNAGGTACNFGYSVSYTGANQSTQPESSNKGTQGGSTALDISLTPSMTNCWLLTMMSCINQDASPSTGTTARATSNMTGTPPTNNGNGIYDSNGTVTGGAADYLHFTSPSSLDSWAYIIFAIAATDSVKIGNAILFGTNF